MPTATAPKKRRVRDPAGTRAKILTEAFNLFYRNGFQATALSEIITASGVTKGALYHHFAGKADLGYAVVDEVLGRAVERLRLRMIGSGDPLQALITWLETPMGDVLLGCPVNNLAMEMSPHDSGFRERLEAVFDNWRGAIAQAIARAQELFIVRGDVDPDSVAAFVLASYEGAVSLARNSGSVEPFRTATAETKRYLATLGWA